MQKKIALFNSLSRKKELFRPLKKGHVGLYTCGPTVYNFAHIGNLRTYVFEDILRKTLEHAGYKVRHVMNITDVGHLTSDADSGEDKMEKGALREGKSVRDTASLYTKIFLDDIMQLNIARAHVLAPATHHIKEQIALAKVLVKKGYAYKTPQAVYFDVAKFKHYGKLSSQRLEDKITGAREEVIVDPEKKNRADFALWFGCVGRFVNHAMRWPSPWGEGFPGWHIECSAISTKFLGQPFDIHTGGVDHISVHHTNEIAQSEAAFGKPLANFWIHGEFLLIDEAKVAKSAKNFITLNVLTQKGYSPSAYRYLVLTTHYRSKLNFTWDSLAAAEHALGRLYDFARDLARAKKPQHATRLPKAADDLGRKFAEHMYNDLNSPEAVAEIWKYVSEYRKNPEKFDSKTLLKILLEADHILGLGLKRAIKETVPQRIRDLTARREEHRSRKEWAQADALRKEISSLGFEVLDTSEGPVLRKLLTV